MNTQKNSTEEKSLLHWIVPSLWLGTLILIFLYSAWSYLFGDKPVSNCKMTTKEVQTIKKLDGDVTSVETEMVYGCEYPDGTFIPSPDN